MNDKYIQYDIDYISGVMSLREPQRKSLEILDDIMKNSDNLLKQKNLTQTKLSCEELGCMKALLELDL